MSTSIKHTEDIKILNEIHDTLRSIETCFVKETPSSILLEISKYALGEIERCQECDKEILKLCGESQKYIIAENGLFCIDCQINNNLDLCSCNKMKHKSQLKRHEHFGEGLDSFICDDIDHEKCKLAHCNKAICINCPFGGCTNCKQEICDSCLLHQCSFCRTYFDESYSSLCKQCIRNNPNSDICIECHQYICWNCNSFFVTSCSMPHCDNKFHSIWNNMDTTCCSKLCDVDCRNCQELQRIICLKHTDKEIMSQRKKLGLIKCDTFGCNRYFCKESMEDTNICRFCADINENVYVDYADYNISTQCCDDYRCEYH